MSKSVESLEAAAAAAEFGPYGGGCTGYLTDEWYKQFLDDLQVPHLHEEYAGMVFDTRLDAKRAVATVFSWLHNDEQLELLARAARAWRRWKGYES